MSALNAKPFLQDVVKSFKLKTPIRIIGLSYSLTNAREVAEWIKCPSSNNFLPNLRHRPLNIKIQTFNNNYDETTSAMSQIVFQNVMNESPNRPVIVSCSNS